MTSCNLDKYSRRLISAAFGSKITAFMNWCNLNMYSRRGTYSSSLILCVAAVAALETVLAASAALLFALSSISLILEFAATIAADSLLVALSKAPCSGP